MIWSDDARLLRHPFVAYRELAGVADARPLRTALERALLLLLLAIGSSDYHAFSVLGLTRTLVFARGDGEGAVMDALRAGRTVVFDREARAYGNAELIELLEREPYAMRAQDYGYRGGGWLDRAARALGWLGVVGLVVFRRRRHD